MNIRVISASKYLQSAETAPSMVMVVTADEIQKYGVVVPAVGNNLFASMDSWYMSRRPTLSGATVGGFGIVNATLLSRNLGQHTEFSAGLYNLFDKNYADPGAKEHLQDALRQDGRNFRLRLTFRF